MTSNNSSKKMTLIELLIDMGSDTGRSYYDIGHYWNAVNRAADEIERLRAALQWLLGWHNSPVDIANSRYEGRGYAPEAVCSTIDSLCALIGKPELRDEASTSGTAPTVRDGGPAEAGHLTHETSVPSHEALADHLRTLNASTRCPVCGKDGIHEHTPTELIIYRNGVKYGRSLYEPGIGVARLGQCEAVVPERWNQPAHRCEFQATTEINEQRFCGHHLKGSVEETSTIHASVRSMNEPQRSALTLEELRATMHTGSGWAYGVQAAFVLDTWAKVRELLLESDATTNASYAANIHEAAKLAAAPIWRWPSDEKASCDRCGGSGRLTIHDTPTYIGQPCSPIGDEPCPKCQPENGSVNEEKT